MKGHACKIRIDIETSPNEWIEMKRHNETWTDVGLTKDACMNAECELPLALSQTAFEPLYRISYPAIPFEKSQKNDATAMAVYTRPADSWKPFLRLRDPKKNWILLLDVKNEQESIYREVVSINSDDWLCLVYNRSPEVTKGYFMNTCCLPNAPDDAYLFFLYATDPTGVSKIGLPKPGEYEIRHVQYIEKEIIVNGEKKKKTIANVLAKAYLIVKK